tara:strand:+ start:21517 stop:22344 length:828 start_codon:yes stop_codon:yes gene_type:complete
MKNTYVYTIGLLIVVFTSCEEVIGLDLTNVASQVVIEGFVTDKQGPYTIQISKTVDFYEANSFPLQENAVVRIFDDRGNDEILSETSPGMYETTSLQGERGATYTLEVALEGKVYTAISKMPEALIPLDSINTEFLEESIFNDEGYYASAFFNDIPDLDEYFRLQVLVNGEVYFFIDEEDEGAKPEEDINFWLTNDKFTDGNLQDYEFPHTLKVGDTVHVTLANLDRSTFDYYRTLVDVIYGDGVAPSNPISNMKDGALGYFGAFSVTANSLVVE